MSLDQLQHELFAQLLNNDFMVVDDPRSMVPITLVEVGERIVTPHQESYSLVFLGPGEHLLPQGTHKITSPKTGDLDIFLVPIGLDQAGYRYEAVFNRLIS